MSIFPSFALWLPAPTTMLLAAYFRLRDFSAASPWRISTGTKAARARRIPAKVVWNERA